ncbi:MAG: hypothetical protein K0V04_12720, partial [Deltaproteobacteria bacterium]|nr:hypothetical protein [Deltaproteobacteria bacterium]
PFWKNTPLIGFMGAIIATIPPSLTAIQEYFQTEREVRLAMTQYQHERTISYLDRALSPETEEAKQAQVFRFLRYLPEEDPIRKWADGELPLVERALGQIEEQILEAEKELGEARAQKEAQTDAVAATIDKVGPTEALEPIVAAMQMQVADKDRDIDMLERKVDRLKIRAGETPAPTAAAGAAVLSAGFERPSLWSNKISVEPTLDKALEAARTVRQKGGQPEIYLHNSLYYLFIGRYGTKDAANKQVPSAVEYLNEGVFPTDLALWCGESVRRTGFIECRS